jgi:hypothetical protein
MLPSPRHPKTDPTTWLAKWWDPNGRRWPELPDELAGLNLSYYPIKPSSYGSV